MTVIMVKKIQNSDTDIWRIGEKREVGEEEEKKTETVPFGDHRIPTKHYKEENSHFLYWYIYCTFQANAMWPQNLTIASEAR